MSNKKKELGKRWARRAAGLPAVLFHSRMFPLRSMHYNVVAGRRYTRYANTTHPVVVQLRLQQPAYFFRHRTHYGLTHAEVTLFASEFWYDAHIAFKELGPEDATEWHFYLELKMRVDHHFYLALVAEHPDLLDL